MSDIVSFDALNPYQMCDKAATAMEGKATKSAGRAFMLAIMAGAFIGLGFMYCGVSIVSGAGKIVGGLAFSMGLMLVILLGADLFTSTTMTLIPRACCKISWSQMFANWAVVYFGNFVGSLLLVAIVLISGHPWEGGGAISIYYINTATHKLSHTFIEAVFLGIMCNVMVCLAVWMSYAGRSALDKMAACLMPIGMFVACGFEHSVANMFMIPMGILCSRIMPPEVAAKLGDPAHITTLLTWGNFITKNLIPVTIGNIIGGGVFVGLYHWYLYLRHHETSHTAGHVLVSPVATGEASQQRVSGGRG